ncbi:MAG: hypothetical protein AAF125_02340, partial [Chloroflexota bacterium]
TFALTIGQPERYGLLPPFIEGMLSGSDGAAIIDGYEHSYIYARPEQFEAAREQIQTIPLQHQPSTQVRAGVGFGLWIDVNCGDGGLPPEGCGFSPEGFRVALDSALQSTDQYVWVYNQRVDWYDNERIPDVWWELLDG